MDRTESVLAAMEALGYGWKLPVTLAYAQASDDTDFDRRWQISLGTSDIARGATAEQAVNALLANLQLESDA